MKTETILKKVNEVITTNDFTKLNQLKIDLEEEIRKESCKLKGLKMDSAIKKLLKNASFTPQDCSFEYKKKRAFTDNFRVYIVNDDYGYLKDEELEEPRNLPIEKVIPRIDMYTQEIKVDITDLQTFVKIHKAEKNISNEPYILETDIVTHDDKKWRIGFNSEYLLDMLKAFKTDIIYTTTSNVNPCLTSLNLDNEFGLLLPVRIKEEV